jgi:hypothetical protein
MAESVFKWFKDSGVMVGVNTPGNISDEVWDAFLTDLSASDYACYIGCSLGILEVTAPQRKQAAAALRNNKVALAVITDDVLVRGVVTAVSWLGANVKSFAWKDIDRALERLEVIDRKSQIMRTIERLRGVVVSEAEQRKQRRRELLKQTESR